MFKNFPLFFATTLVSSFLFADGELKFDRQKTDSGNKIIESDGTPVQPNKSGYMGHGYIVGSPINSGFTGPFYKTYEVHINQGRFNDDKTYIGSNVNLSIDNRNMKIFESFRAIENRNHELFVFEYNHKSAWNPEIEDSHLFLTKIYTIEEFLDHISGHDIPQGIKARNPWKGYSGDKKKMGRIVDVERNGLIGDFCAVEVNLGGLSSGSSGSSEALVTLSVIDEDICAWIEKAIAYGRDVEIDVSQDMVEMWQPSSMFITSIKFKDADESTQLQTEQLSDKQYQDLKKRLLADPDFIKEMLKHAQK